MSDSKSTLILHCGAREVTREELDRIEPPAETQTWKPIKHAVGAWNFIEVSPSHMTGSFNGFVKSVVLRISEGRDLCVRAHRGRRRK